MQAFHVDTTDGYRLYVYHPPAEHARKGLAAVYVPPFAEEMNKCRHMAAAAARRMADAGVAVLIPDLAGCGDSSGDFGDATWTAWLDDIDRAAAWLTAQGHPRLVLWAVRLGALLAVQNIELHRGRFERCLLWQPICSGEQALTQFLRLRVANEMLSGKTAGATLAGLRNQIASAQSVEIAGYRLAPELASSIEKSRLADANPGCPVQWLEVASDPSRGVAPASAQVVERWKRGGTPVDTSLVQGEPFWTSANNEDVIDCERLLELTSDLAKRW